MRVVIDFKITEDTLEMAIVSLLTFGYKVTKKNIINAIKAEVACKGSCIIDFPEFWGYDSDDAEFYEARKYVDIFRYLINQ